MMMMMIHVDDRKEKKEKEKRKMVRFPKASIASHPPTWSGSVWRTTCDGFVWGKVSVCGTARMMDGREG
jgi:hypothetical protein